MRKQLITTEAAQNIISSQETDRREKGQEGHVRKEKKMNFLSL